MKNLSFYILLTTISFINNMFCSQSGNEMIFVTTEGTVVKQGKGKEVWTYSEPKLNDNFASEEAKLSDKGIIIVDQNRTPKFVQTVNYVKPKENELEILFNSLSDQSLQVTKFYNYFDVLNSIDKSMALIEKILCIPQQNISLNAMIRQKKASTIYPKLKNATEELNRIKNIFCEKENKSTKPFKYKYIIDGLTRIEKQIELLKEQHRHYRLPKIQVEYEFTNGMRVPQLKALENHFEKVRKAIYPFKEDDILKYADLFKNNWISVLKNVYEKLLECYENEKKILNWLVEVLDDILEGTENCIEELKSYENEKLNE